MSRVMGIIVWVGVSMFASGSASAEEDEVYKELPEVVVKVKEKEKKKEETKRPGSGDQPKKPVTEIGGGGGGNPKDEERPKDPCEVFAKKIEPFMTDKPVEKLSKAIPADAKVIMLGEDHTDLDAKSRYPEIFQMLKDDHQADCVVFEKPQKGISSGSPLDWLSRIFRGDGSMESFCKGTENYGAYSGWQEWERAAAYATCNGMRVYSGDINFPNYWDNVSVSGVGKRNVWMANYVSGLLNSKTCKKVVMINGQAHFYKDGKEGRLGDLFDGRGFKSHSAYLFSREAAQVGINIPECPELFEKESALLGTKDALSIVDIGPLFFKDQILKEFLSGRGTVLIFKDLK